MPRNEVRKAAQAEVGALARALGRAFQDDPVFTWVLPDERRRQRTLAPGFELFLRRIWIGLGETYAGGDAVGGAIWHPPGLWRLSSREQLCLLPGFARVWGRTTPRALRSLLALEGGHPAEPHYYLAVLGVEPAEQGRGLGSQLMHPVLSRCDRDGVGAYLEASSPANCALYERHGFVVTSAETIGRGAPPIWRMWREPGA